MNKISGIYKIINPNGRIYIGQSTDIIQRKSDYRKLECKEQPKIYNSIVKYGWEVHVFEIQEICDTVLLDIRERYWQDYYDVTGQKGLNCILIETDKERRIICKETKEKISNSLKGRKLSKEHKQNLSDSHKGQIPWHKGKKMSKEYCKKISEISKGRVSPMKGRKHSVKTLQKMSKSLKGRKAWNEGIPHSEETKEKIRQIKLKKNVVQSYTYEPEGTNTN